MSSDESKSNQVITAIIGGLVTLLIGGSAPWWWKEVFPQKSPIIPELNGGNPSKLPEMTGVWDIKATLNKTIHRDGFIYESEGEFAEFVIQFELNSNSLKGNIVGARGSGNPCSEATISGEVVDRKVSYVVHYTGRCCHNEKMTFTGSVSEDASTLFGKLKPVGIPTGDCQLWFADIRGYKRVNQSSLMRSNVMQPSLRSVNINTIHL